MHVEIKFCGMTRPEDVREGGNLGADFVGVIFAGGPRSLTVPRAADVLSALTSMPKPPRTVGVFGDIPPEDVVATASTLRLDAVQLHGESSVRVVDQLRLSFAGEIWAVVRVAGSTLPDCTRELFAFADAVVLDAKVPGRLGGTGVELPWEALAPQLTSLRGRAKLVVAGGLRAENVGTAIALLRPDVVDVSSGVETAPGIKDHARMRAFRDAVRRSE